MSKKINNIHHKVENGSLHLRSLGASEIELLEIINSFNIKSEPLESFSFSYNKSLGDVGMISLVKKLPTSLREVGFVDCGISEKGGIALLNWIKLNHKIEMVCIEGNDFSSMLQDKFRDLSLEMKFSLYI
jgi:hypothetical protein